MSILTAFDAITRQLGIAADLPDPNPARRNPWHPVNPCPACGEKWSAAINYEGGWFVCHHCEAKASWGGMQHAIMLYGEDGDRSEDCTWSVEDDSTHWLSRFAAQIDSAAKKAARKFASLDEETARAYAQWRVCVYAALMPPAEVDRGPGDWAKLFDWDNEIAARTADAAEREHMLDGWVWRALYADLIDYGKHRLGVCYLKDVDGSWVRREDSLDQARRRPARRPGRSGGPDAFDHRHPTLFDWQEPDPSPEEQVLAAVPDLDIPWDDWPYLAARYRDELAYDDIAVKFECSKSTAHARVKRELGQVLAIVARQREERAGPCDPFRPAIRIG